MVDYQKNTIFFKNHSEININLIPGITNITCVFQIIDYYGQNMKSYNGSSSQAYLQNFKKFTTNTDISFVIDGISSTTVVNGI